MFFIKRADHTRSSQIFSRDPEHRIQFFLDSLIKRHGYRHNAEYHDRQHRDRHHEDHRRFPVDRKRHDHCAKDDKRGAEEQTQKHIDAVLCLIDITGHTGDER